MRDLEVVIIGAGIGGLTAALALQRAGFGVAVYEAAPELGEIGAGLTVASNGSIVLQHLGLGPVLDEFACKPEAGAVRHYRDGRTLVHVPHGAQTVRKYGAPYCQIHRADLHAALVAAVRDRDPGCIHLDRAFVDLSESAGRITAQFGDGSSASGDLLIGCDGIRSTVRARLFGADQPRFTGFAAWRGMVAMDDLPPGAVEPDTAVYMGEGRYVTRYKVRAGTLVNYVATARTDDWTEEGWAVPSTAAAVQQAFADFHQDIQVMLAATPPDACYRWGIFDRPPLPEWSVGRATLLGDAAHPMCPFLGQGGVMAIEDAMIIARCLAVEDSIAATLARYEAARRDRVAFVHAESRRVGEALTTIVPDAYGPDRHRNEESLDLARYDAVTAPI